MQGYEGMSPVRKELDKEALTRARLWTKKKVAEQSNITELADLRAAAVKELALAESQLNGAVQGKLDALKRSVDLMEESTMKLAGFTETMNDVESRIQRTSTLIVTYPHLRKIQNARDNLSKVIAQVESFLNVPNRVAELRQLLLENPDRIKSVFLDALSLEAWRRCLKTEINSSRERKKRDAAAGGQKDKVMGVNNRPRKTSTVDQYSVQMLDSIDNFVDKHLGIILKLSTEVKNVFLEILRDYLTLHRKILKILLQLLRSLRCTSNTWRGDWSSRCGVRPTSRAFATRTILGLKI